MDLVAPWHVGSSQTSGRTCVPHIGRQILNSWTTREVPTLWIFHLLSRGIFAHLTGEVCGAPALLPVGELLGWPWPCTGSQWLRTPFLSWIGNSKEHPAPFLRCSLGLSLSCPHSSQLCDAHFGCLSHPLSHFLLYSPFLDSESTSQSKLFP